MRIGRFFLLVTCFLMGFAVLGLELVGFRLYGPVYGYSSYVAGTLIGVILAALSLGYIVGGRLADRVPRPPVLYRIIVITGLLLVAFAFLYRSLLNFFFLKFGMITGLVIVTILLYGPPTALLGMTSPFIIRLVVEKDRVGTAAGTIYALSTVGSILGSFVTPFVLVPEIGAHMTLIIMAAIVLVVGVIGLAGVRRRWVAAVLALALLPFSVPKEAEEVVLRVQSPYSDLQVERDDATHPPTYRLAVNDWAWYSKGVPDTFRTGSYFDYFLLGPALVPVEEMAILGMGAGTSIKQFQHFFPAIHIDAVEIDPWVVKIAKDTRYFGMREGPKLTIYTEDARPYLRRCKKRYDLVEIDVFQGGPLIPFYVVTEEFFRLVSDRMSADGVAITNVIALANDRLLISCIAKTMQQAFPSVYVLQVPAKSNFLVFAFKREMPPAEVRRRLRAVSTAGLVELASLAADGFTVPDPYPGTHVLTDDKADVARITFNMVRRYANAKFR